jgi:isocitrate dehydrogenase
MMKVSDPIMFGHCVSVFYAEALDKHADTLGRDRRQREQRSRRRPREARPAAGGEEGGDRGGHRGLYATRPSLAMVDSRKGITNLHVPNNVIIDASMPNVVRDGGKMWNKDDALQDTIAMIPDRSYATMYQAILDGLPATRGSSIPPPWAPSATSA